MQVLKEICLKDPINATYITTYVYLLVDKSQSSDQTDPNLNPEQ